ncbi:MAG TPA: protein-L-isoaspartate(D-aspartate) O-methyltransferase [Pirellulales bacterium]|nr:protein-L-isoaspartate(D-aspartate) O-methyltransferase [Pirellulales bacterium]
MKPHDNEDYRQKRQSLLGELSGQRVASPQVLAVMARVPREKFVDRRLKEMAYVDTALPIDCGQTISQPTIVAMMTEALCLTGHERVLEIGTGSGYQAAVLAELAGSVVTMERHAQLAQQAAKRLAELGYKNVLVLHADGSRGCPERAPFDRIIVTAAAAECPPALFEQLAEGGILVAPLGLGDWYGQTLVQIRKVNGAPVRRELCGCMFVPLVADPVAAATSRPAAESASL